MDGFTGIFTLRIIKSTHSKDLLARCLGKETTKVFQFENAPCYYCSWNGVLGVFFKEVV